MPKRVRVADDVVFEVLEGEVVLLNLATGLYFSLDRVGTAMWQALEREGDLDAVEAILLARFEVEQSVLRADLESLVKMLLEEGLLKPG